MEDMMCRHTMIWVRHVATMPLYRRPKQVMFGWVKGCAVKKPQKRDQQNLWYRKVIQSAGVEDIEWFRLAQSRRDWKTNVNDVFPMIRMSKAQRR